MPILSSALECLAHSHQSSQNLTQIITSPDASRSTPLDILYMPQFLWSWVLAELQNHLESLEKWLGSTQDQLNKNLWGWDPDMGCLLVCLYILFLQMILIGSQSPHFVVIFLLLFVVFSLPRHGKCLIYLCLPSNWGSYWHIVGGQGFFLNSKWNTHENRATLTELIKSINSIYSTSYSWKVFMDISFKVPMQSSGWEVLDFISNPGHNSKWKLKWWWGEQSFSLCIFSKGGCYFF